MKLWPVTTLAKSNMATLKKFDDDAISVNRDLILIFPIYGKFGAIRKPDSGHMVCKTYIFINSSLLCYKNWKQNQKISNTALILLFWVKALFLTNADFLKKEKKNADNIKEVLVLKGIFSETTYVRVLPYKKSGF